MDDKQFDSLQPVVDYLVKVEVQCSNLKNRLKIAPSEFKKVIKPDNNPKPVLNATAAFAKEIDKLFPEVRRVLGFKEKDLLAMTMAVYKGKASKMYQLLGPASNAAGKFWDEYNSSRRNNSGIGASTSGKAAWGYSEALIDAIAAVKVKYNQLK